MGRADFGLPAAYSIERLRRWSHRLDRAFRIPGTRIRFGWDSIIGLVPGLGDAVTALFSALVLAQAFRSRVPGVIKARMLLNTLLDLALGTIPVLGDLFDVVWKSHVRNFELLEKHGIKGATPRAGDWAFVLGSIALVLAAIALPVLLIAALISGLGESPPGYFLPF